MVIRHNWSCLAIKPNNKFKERINFLMRHSALEL